MPNIYENQNTNKSSNSRITVGLDIGTTKICALVASVNDTDQKLNVLGIGIAESEGLNRGVVVNIEKTTKAIRNVIEQAEQQSGIKITEVNIGIAGDHIESIQSKGIITISSPTNEISQSDVDRLLDECRRINIPSERKILHVIPQDFILDGQDGIPDPVGMDGIRLEANVHIITAMSSAVQNISRCVERAGLKIKNLVLEPLASAKAVLSIEEKEVGVALVDIGGGTTDIAVFYKDIIRHTSVFGIAGNQVTTDLQQGLAITHSNAERVKREFGHTFGPSIVHDESIMIPGIPGRRPHEISKSYLCQILQPRMQEIFEMIYGELQHSGYMNLLGAGIVITGGSTLLRGTEELATEILNRPVRTGIPSNITYAGLAPEVESPIYATAVGLALWGSNDSMAAYEEKVAIKENIAEVRAMTDAPVKKDDPYKLPQQKTQIQEINDPETIDNENKESKYKQTMNRVKTLLSNL